jgi:hypothetical protein
VAKAKGLEREMRGKLWKQKLGRENRNWRFDGDFKVKEIFFPPCYRQVLQRLKITFQKRDLSFIVLVTHFGNKNKTRERKKYQKTDLWFPIGTINKGNLF